MLQCDVVVGDGVFFLAEKAGNAANASKSLGWVGADPADYANFYGLVKVMIPIYRTGHRPRSGAFITHIYLCLYGGNSRRSRIYIQLMTYLRLFSRCVLGERRISTATRQSTQPVQPAAGTDLGEEGDEAGAPLVSFEVSFGPRRGARRGRWVFSTHFAPLCWRGPEESDVAARLCA